MHRESPLHEALGAPGGEPPTLRFRTVWISDLHLGTPGCQAAALLDFLRAVECETLFLVGDIIDGWQLRRQWYWPQAHNDVVQKLLRKARKGTRVIFVPGNHDEFARKYAAHNFGGVDVVDDWMHETADGRKLWVVHGDLFDGVIQCARWLAYVGDWAYETTLKVNRHLNSLRARLGLPYWSLSRYLKLKVKRAVSYVSDFEAAVAREARRRGAQGVVCGHIHHAEMRDIDGILYANDGDWVESLTALVEHADGRLEIIEWAAVMAARAEHAARGRPNTAPALAFTSLSRSNARLGSLSEAPMTQNQIKTTSRNSFLTAAICVAAASGLSAPTGAQAVTLDYIGQQIVPSGTPYAGTTVGGLSSLDFDRSKARYFAISDDRSGINPARFYTLGLDLNKFQRSGTPGMDGVNFSSATTILTPAGAAFAPNTLDPEGLRYDAARGSLLWSNEGQRNAGGLQNPTVREMKVDGSHLRDFVVPTIFNPAGTVAGTDAADRGVRNNLAFENLALSRDGKTVWAATENALVQDGPAAAVGVKSASRVLSFDVATGKSGGQYIYEVDAVTLPPAAPGLFATNGLTDFIEVGERQFITIERSFAAGAQTPGVGPNGLPTGNTIRLYLADARQATDVSGLESIAGQAAVPMTKSLLLDLSTLKNDDGTFLATDNIEGITFGPEFNGQRTLMLVSDNNFSGTQFTQFIALGITGAVPEPGTWAMLIVGIAAVGVARSKRPT